MGIETRTVGELIDMLTITNLKIWFAIEEETADGVTDSDRGKAGKKVLELNKKRHALIDAINNVLGEDYFREDKTY